MHVPTLLDGILEATATKAGAEARITSLRATLEAEGRRRLEAEGAAPAWNVPQLGKVRLDPPGDWTPHVDKADEFASFAAEHYPSEVTAAIAIAAEDLPEALQALEFVGITVNASTLATRPAWRERYLEDLTVDVEEEVDASGQTKRTVTAVDDNGLIVPGIGATKKAASLVVSLDRDRRTAALREAQQVADELVEQATEDSDTPVDHAALHARRVELEGLHADQLAAIAKGHQLGTSGTKAALAERIARAELSTGRVITVASELPAPAASVLPEGTEVEEVSTVPLDPEEAGDLEDLVAEVEAAPEVILEESPEQEAATLTPYDDDRPGMMRVHIAQERALAIEAIGSREVIRQHAKRVGVSAAGTKGELALRLAQAGHTADTLTAPQERTA